MSTNVRSACFSILLLSARLPATAQNHFTDADVDDIKAFLNDNFANTNAGMVVGIVHENGSRIISRGKLDNDTGQEVDGDTVFEIGSVTKTFTSLLFLDMVERGEMKLHDPVAKYLPASVKVPSHGSKEISLRNLAAQDSGLPFNADNLSGKDWKERFDAYTIDQLYAFLSSHTLMSDPGAKFQYSNIGMTLLGHVMELNAGTSYESLVVNRICKPLGMDSTCMTLAPELKARTATGHDASGLRAPYFDLRLMAGAGALRSTANDLLKYVSANLGLTPSGLTPLMVEMQLIRHRDSPEFGQTAMPWMDFGIYQPPGMELLGHGGGTGGCSAFIGFDRMQRRGVVVLSNQNVALSKSYWIGWRILQAASLKGVDLASMEPVREIVGLGTAVDIDQGTKMLRITRVYPKSPASNAGLSAGLVVQRINEVPTEGKSLAECLGLLRGEAGTKLRLELVNPERKGSNLVELTRQKFLISNP